MSNLIITIISIGLVAIAAIMGIYYGGKAYQSAQINATATTIISEANQILAAQRLWATNNNQPDATNAYMNTLVTAQVISYPTASLAQLGAAVPTNVPTWDNTSYVSNGTTVQFKRILFTYNNGNYISYGFSNVGNAFTIAKTINSSLGATSTQPYINGIPQYTGGTSSYLAYPPAWWSSGGTNPQVCLDSNGNLIVNMCYLSPGSIVNCVFGPS